ncbi:MAG TPA: efflux RND transporter periplasmic adaptor subunit [Pyrinomonadaceae bacterium]|nr:efflux RND transporter periplasmic adaptor subunit [Pyrinomonadaceae bacterium]
MKMKLGGKRRFLVALLAVVAAGSAAYWYWGTGASAAPYMTARVERGSLRNTVTATGTLEAVTTVEVGSQASGTIAALYADFNSQVKKGQVIAQLDPSVAQAQVAQARANLEQARAGLQQSRAGLVQSRAGVSGAQAQAIAAGSTVQNQRAGVSGAEANLAVLKAQLDDAQSFLRQQESLATSGVISLREVETARTALLTAQARYNQAQTQVRQAVLSEQSAASAGNAQARSQVEQAQAQVGQAQAQTVNAGAQVRQAEAALQLAEINLAHTTIRSPIDGVVVSRDVDVGQTVAASLSAPKLFTIAQDLTQMQVIANIDQADIGLVEQAKGVRFTVDAFPDAEFDGSIQQMRLNPVSAQNVVTYNVVIDVANPEQKLKPGMTANLTVTIDERADVLKVANAALRFTPQLTEEERAALAARRNAGGGQQQGGQRRSRQQDAAQATGDASNAQGNSQQGGGARGGGTAAPTAPVVEGQTRRVWVLTADGRVEPRRIKVGLSDGASTEVVEGDLREGDMVVTGQNVSASQGGANRQQRQGGAQTAPGFGGAPRGGAGGGRR